MQCLVQWRGQVEDILLLALWPVLSLEFAFRARNNDEELAWEFPVCLK